ncbi:Photoreceptor ankyrin repeat protein [Amphibalanus amphitrite]|uniref:Photoreceptor ankyrin repeat protein n=1 Tax=Amphibalanus amphitrite TaxID=1232801 RepID=A0A6A4VKC4_AMPAM|nr:Photoreceptor ankyrin repeat protein [Amphibalanus amphitrite]
MGVWHPDGSRPNSVPVSDSPEDGFNGGAMSGYRRSAGGFYVSSAPCPPLGTYGSSLSRYDLSPASSHHLASTTRLVSSSGVPRRYQVYSRNDTPLGLTNYDVIRRAADPLSARYRQNRHSWAAGGSSGLARSSTVASRHRPPPAEGADVETPAMVARRQRRIRRTASSPEVGDRLVRVDAERSARGPQLGMAPLRRRMVITQQTQKPRELMTLSSLHDQFLEVCIRLNEARFREVMLVAARIATAATVNQTDASGRTALSHLCVHGNGRCVEEFSRLPFVDANLADRDGNTPLHHAAQAGHAAVVSALLENYTEIEVDAKNGKGITPLIKACVQGKSKCAKLLLSHGADPLIRDPTRGLTCIEWSYYCGRRACARLVESYLLARDTPAAPGAGGGLKRYTSEPELATADGAAGWCGAKFRRLLGRCSPPPGPPGPPPRQRRPSLPAAGEARRHRQAPPRPPARLPHILVEEVEVAVDPVIVRYGDWVAPSQRPRQHNQVGPRPTPSPGLQPAGQATGVESREASPPGRR